MVTRRANKIWEGWNSVNYRNLKASGIGKGTKYELNVASKVSGNIASKVSENVASKVSENAEYLESLRK